jgi:PAS domain S-box-containing protein
VTAASAGGAGLDREARLKDLVGQMPGILWSTDQDLKITSAMGGSLPAFHVKGAAPLGMTLYDFFQTRDENHPPIARHRRALEGEAVAYEFERAGRVFAAHLEPLRDASGAIRGVVGVALDITERVRAEEEADRSMALLRATLESTADGILVVDTEGKIVSYNRKFVEMWRLPEQLVAARVDAAVLQFVLDQLKDSDRFLKKVRDLYDQPDSQSYDWLEFKDGRVFERYSQPHRVGDVVIGRVWSFRDVTDRARMEEMLRRQARTVEHVFDAVVVTDLSGRILDWNPGAERLFGYARDTVLGKTPALVHVGEEAASLTGRMLDGVRRFGKWTGTVRFRRQNGSEGVCQTLVVPHTDEFGRALAAIFVHRETLATAGK